MLYHVITEGDDISYIPTPLGKAVLVITIIALLAVALAFARKKA